MTGLQSDAAPPMRHPGLLLALIAVIACVSVVSLPPVQVFYHNYQMRRAQDEMWAKPDVIHGNLIGYRHSESSDRYEYHRQRLVQLGAVRELQFRLRNIKVPTEEAKHFSQFLLSTGHPSCIDFVSDYPDQPQLMVLTVWCYPGDVNQWEKLIAARDVVGYKSRFILKKTAQDNL